MRSDVPALLNVTRVCGGNGALVRPVRLSPGITEVVHVSERDALAAAASEPGQSRGTLTIAPVAKPRFPRGVPGVGILYTRTHL